MTYKKQTIPEKFYYTTPFKVFIVQHNTRFFYGALLVVSIFETVLGLFPVGFFLRRSFPRWSTPLRLIPARSFPAGFFFQLGFSTIYLPAGIFPIFFFKHGNQVNQTKLNRTKTYSNLT